MVDVFKEKLDNHNVHKDDEKSSRLTKDVPKTVVQNKRRNIDWNEFKWVLSSLSMMANFYLNLGMAGMCEKMLVKYITLIEEFY